jgi:hypothetical protein
MTMRLAMAVLLGLAISLAACRGPRSDTGRVSIDAQGAGIAEVHAAIAPAAPSRDVLGVFEGPHYSYELSIERCERSPEQTFRGNPECPFRVRLMESGKAVDTVALPETACGPPRPMKVDRAFGTAPEARAWITGTEACQAGVAAMTVTLSERDLALLVTQRIGWERVARRHVLYRVDKGKLRSVWSADEGLSSSSITSVSVLPLAGASSQDVAFMRVQLSDDEVAERLVATRLRWDPVAAQIVESPLPDLASPLSVRQVGPFKTVAAARAARMRLGASCFRDYDLMPVRLLPGGSRSGFLLAMVFATRGAATTMGAGADHCPGATKSQILEYGPRTE